MTIYSHNGVMSSAKVSELKAKLSAYLTEVRGGGTVVVYDRNTPIARLVPFDSENDDLLILEESASPSERESLKASVQKRPSMSINCSANFERIDDRLSRLQRRASPPAGSTRKAATSN